MAEDNPVNQKLAERLLTKRGHRVTVVESGSQAVESVQQTKFDLVLMDVQMPDMDGLEAAASIRRLESNTGEHVRIIAMTAHAMHGDRERCLESGMDGYLAKPIRPEELFQIVEAIPPGTEPKGSGAGAKKPAILDREPCGTHIQSAEDMLGIPGSQNPV